MSFAHKSVISPNFNEPSVNDDLHVEQLTTCNFPSHENCDTIVTECEANGNVSNPSSSKENETADVTENVSKKSLNAPD